MDEGRQQCGCFADAPVVCKIGGGEERKQHGGRSRKRVEQEARWAVGSARVPVGLLVFLILDVLCCFLFVVEYALCMFGCT